MPSIASLVVKIGGDTAELTRALATVGEKARGLDSDLKKLGNTPLGTSAQKSLDSMRATMTEIAKAQQGVADRAAAAAEGIAQIGGASKLTDSQLKQVNRTLQEGLSAFKALGQEAPGQLKSVASAVSGLSQPLDFFDKKIIAIGTAIGNFLGNAATQAAHALIEAGKEAFRYADTLENLSAATGIGVNALQDLEAIGITSGTSIQTLANSVEQLQKHLDDPAAIKALHQMGLDYATIRNLAPEDQFLEIAKAVAAIEDPVERANAGTALFGRTWFTIAPAIKGNIDELVGSMKKLTDAQLEAIDKAGDRFDLFIANNKRRLTGLIGDLLLAADEAKIHWRDILNPVALGVRLEAGGNRAAIAAQIRDFEALPKIQGGAPIPFGLPTGFQPAVEQTEAIRDLESQIAKAQAAAEKFKAVQDQLFGRATIEHANELVKALGGTENITKLTDTATKHLHDELGQALAAYHALGRDVPPLLQAIYDKTNAIRTITGRTIGTGLSTAPRLVDQIAGTGALPQGQTTINAGTIFERQNVAGGPVDIKAAAATGAKLAVAMNQSLFSGLNTAVPQSILAALQGGGNVTAAVAGTVGSHVATNVVTKFGTAITANLGKTFGGAINAILPGLGALAAPLVNFIAKIFGPSEESSKVSPLRDAFFKAAGGLDVLNPKVLALTGNLKAVQDVFKAKTVDDYNAAIQRLNTVLGAQDAALADLNAAVQKYGFSIEELGPKFRQQKLDELAGSLLKDYDLLIASGIANDTVLQHMAGSFQELANTALRTGAEIPENLKPALQRLVDLGLLVDGDGKKLTNLGGINFSEPMSRGFDRVVAAINNLTRALGGAVAQVDELAQDRDFDITGHVKVDSSNARDLPSTDVPFPEFAGGSNGFRDFGRGTLAVLHGREAVVTEDQVASMNAAQQQSSLSQTATGAPSVNIYITGPVIAAKDYVEQNMVQPILNGISRYHREAFGRLVATVTP